MLHSPAAWLCGVFFVFFLRCAEGRQSEIMYTPHLALDVYISWLRRWRSSAPDWVGYGGGWGGGQRKEGMREDRDKEEGEKRGEKEKE